jgi:2-oxoglutarate ferredoxin oxidoreductase subunit alpha
MVAFGATWGALKEAVEELNRSGEKAGALVYGDIWPFPTKLLNSFGKKAGNIITVEQNFTGQLESLIKEHTDLRISGNIRKYDGRAINGEEIVQSYYNLKAKKL